MLEIEKPIIECIESNEDGTYGKYVVEPLERGYGITLGNAMRRILLSSLPGVATTSVKIDTVLHEFSTVQGVKEDVTELILNIKSLALTMEGEGPKTIYIDAQGPGVVTGADIKTDGDVEVINKDLHIATLDDNGKLYMELTVNRGRGYVTQNKNKSESLPLSAIAVDSIYTPVKRVNFTVENYKDEITDLVGIRVIHIFKEDWEEIHNFITKMWNVNEIVANIRKGDNTKTFEELGIEVCSRLSGYRSVHYLIESYPTTEKVITEVHQIQDFF